MISVHTPIWGDMIQAYIDVAMVCLINNFKKCPEAIDVYTLYASDEAKRIISGASRFREITSLVQVKWSPLPKGEWDVTSCFLEEMRQCTMRKSYVLQFTASCSLGDDSILNISKVADGTRNPILYPDLKISPAGFEAIRSWIAENGNLSNRRLVSIAMKHILSAKYTITPSGPGEWLGIMNVPSPIILPDPQVIDLWSTNPFRGSGYDHVLPYWMHSQGYPFYHVDCSDEYVTADGEIGPPAMKEGQGLWQPDIARTGEKFFADFPVVFKGEQDAC